MESHQRALSSTIEDLTQKLMEVAKAYKKKDEYIQNLREQYNEMVQVCICNDLDISYFIIIKSMKY